MADGELTMFGKAYDTVGSTNKNLVLQTRGDLKVRWGNKFIDLIKNGKINVDVDLLKQVSSKDEIIKDGVYLVQSEEKQEVWLSIGGNLVNLVGEVGTTYVSFLQAQEVTADQKLMALTNAGFFYESIDKAKAANVKSGLIYIIDQQQLYYVKDGVISKYEQELTIPNPLTLGNITIDGSAQRIYGQQLYLGVGNTNYISLSDNITTIHNILITGDYIHSANYIRNDKGYAVYIDANGEFWGEFDNLLIRNTIQYSNTKDITYDTLLQTISDKKLVKNKKYRIIDFQNEWELTNSSECIYDIDDKRYNVRPLIVTAIDIDKLSRSASYEDNPEWQLEYDVTFNKFVRQEIVGTTIYDIYTKGLITKLTDEYGNEANYDFKHCKFKHTAASDDLVDWFFTFNTANVNYNTTAVEEQDLNVYMDASQLGRIKNNVINIPEYQTEEATIVDANNPEQTVTVQKLIPRTEYIIFPDCSVKYPYNNTISKSTGKYVVTQDFYNNSIEGLLQNVSTKESINFDFDFHDNVCKNIYIKGDSEPNTNEKYTSFATGKTYANNVFGNITDCQFNDSIENVKFYDEYYNVYFDVIDCTFEKTITKTTFKGLVQFVDFKGNIVLTTFEKPVGKFSDSRVILNNINDSTFVNEIQKLDATDSTISECIFNAIIAEATISGTLSKCNFQGLSGNILIGKTNQTIANMTIQIAINPQSAEWVQQSGNPQEYQQCNPLKINVDDVPRLAETMKKECFLRTINSKEVFYVQLSTDDNTPSGTIVMFYPGTLETGETLADKIPNGYVICDGLNGTPNLSGRFIKASSSSWGPIDNNDTEVVDNVKTNRIKLSVDNLPEHTHSLPGIQNAATNVASVSSGTKIEYAPGTSEFTPDSVSVSSENHTHTMDSNTGDGDFQNTSFNIEPQAYELIFIMKL